MEIVQSVFTSGGVGSKSEETFLRVNGLDLQGDHVGSQDGVTKKKKSQRVTGTDKNGRGLRQFSMKVCQKVECKGRTTYNEVADELVAEFADPGNSDASPDQQHYDEKNIRRRVYDALNVLMAMNILTKDKKEIQWKGLPHNSLSDAEALKSERNELKSRIEKKTSYLQELEEQHIGLQNLIQHNKSSGNAPNGGVALPFILIETRPHATVEIEISDDMQLVLFDYNNSPFKLRDDNYVLKALKLCKTSQCEDHRPTISNRGEGYSMPNILKTLSQHQH